MNEINNNEFDAVFIPDIIKWGKITGILAILLSFGPALVLLTVFGIMPPLEAILNGFVSIAGAVGVIWVIEPISFFPIVGIPGTYMAFVTGNISNMRIPAATVAQKVAGVTPGTNEGTIIATLGMAVSVVVNIIILAIGVVAGQSILAALPQDVIDSFNYLLPSLFGALFVQFAVAKPKLAPISLALAFLFITLVSNGILPSWTTTLFTVFGTLAIGVFMYKDATE